MAGRGSISAESNGALSEAPTSLSRAEGHSSESINHLQALVDDAIVVVMYWVYIARCADGSLYVGYTANLPVRERQHNEGTGSQYTGTRRPVCIVYSEEHETEQAARTRERQLKGWSRQKKAALAQGDIAQLRALSKRRAR